MKSKLLVVFIILVLASTIMYGCKKQSDDTDDVEETINPQVVVTMQDGKKIKIELYPEYAPKTVENFLSLVDENYYDNTIFHRIIHSFMVQAGSKKIDETNEAVDKGRKDTIEGEFALNGFSKNTLKHLPGVISMARISLEQETEETMNSASTEFFICTGEASHLDGKHAAFGRVMDEESMENVIDISQIPTGKFFDMENFPIPSERGNATISSIERLN